MESTQDRWIDRTDWTCGPWDNEPDRVEWRYLGMPCLIVRGPSSALCGYVGVSPGHPWHGMGYDDIDVSVHGGLTYSNKCQADGHICHVAKPGEPDNVWWIGFDCAHAWDLKPNYGATVKRLGAVFFPMTDEVYRDLGYVRAQVESLARQVAESKP